MELHPVLRELDFVPAPMWFQRPDGNWVAFCEHHLWAYVTSVKAVAIEMCNEHTRISHPDMLDEH